MNFIHLWQGLSNGEHVCGDQYNTAIQQTNETIKRHSGFILRCAVRQIQCRIFRQNRLVLFVYKLQRWLALCIHRHSGQEGNMTTLWEWFYTRHTEQRPPSAHSRPTLPSYLQRTANYTIKSLQALPVLGLLLSARRGMAEKHNTKKSNTVTSADNTQWREFTDNNQLSKCFTKKKKVSLQWFKVGEIVTWRTEVTLKNMVR